MLAPEDEKPYADFLASCGKRWQPVKAAIYTFDSGGFFRLKTQFGFSRTDQLLERFSRMDPLATHVYEHREPFFVNSLRQAGKLVDLLEGAPTTKILTAPIYLDGRIIGIVDVRDKAGRLPLHARGRARDDGPSPPLRGPSETASAVPAGRDHGRRGTKGRGFTPAPDTPALGSRGMPPVRRARTGESGIVVRDGLSRIPAVPRGTSRRWSGLRTRRRCSGETTRLGRSRHDPSAQMLRLVEETLSRMPVVEAVRARRRRGPSPAEADFSRLYLQTCLQFTGGRGRGRLRLLPVPARRHVRAAGVRSTRT